MRSPPRRMRSHRRATRSEGGVLASLRMGSKGGVMPRGDKTKYTDKEKRQAEHIEEGYLERGVSEEEAESRAWATVNKIHGGGEKRQEEHTSALQAHRYI